MRRLMGMLAALAFSAAAAFADAPVKTARVDFTSQPEGAEVAVDGEVCGNTPLPVFSLAPGSHRVHYELPDYEPVDEYITIVEGEVYKTRHAALVPQRGILLVTSEPAGCDVSLDGLSLGETPLLITSLLTKEPYNLLLQKTGYQNRMLDVKFTGRKPLVRHAKMLLDSGALTITSEPQGAEVMVNGVARGKTPLSVQEIPKGRAKIVLTLKGYQTETRDVLLNAGSRENVFVKFEGDPGSLLVTSVPDGARIYIDGKSYNKAPVKLDKLKPGIYEVKAEMDGHNTISRKVTVGLGQAVSEEFRLDNIRGRLEVRSTPVGAQVIVDGRLVGTTSSSTPAAESSDYLMVENLDEGEHTLVIRKDGYAEIVSHPKIERLRTTRKKFRMRRVFTPNVEITTENGTYRGVFIDASPEGIVVEVSMGAIRTFRREDVKVKFLTGPNADK